MHVVLHLSISALPSGLNEVRKTALRGLLLQIPTLQEHSDRQPPILVRESQETNETQFWFGIGYTPSNEI